MLKPCRGVNGATSALNIEQKVRSQHRTARAITRAYGPWKTGGAESFPASEFNSWNKGSRWKAVGVRQRITLGPQSLWRAQLMWNVQAAAKRRVPPPPITTRQEPSVASRKIAIKRSSNGDDDRSRNITVYPREQNYK